LLLGALLVGALLIVPASYAAAAEDDWDYDTVTSRVLKITVYATSTKHPKEYQALRVFLPYQSRHTCEEGLDETDLGTIIAAAQYKFSKHLRVTRATAECIDAGPNI
jgi:hypothetical protein